MYFFIMVVGNIAGKHDFRHMGKSAMIEEV